MPPLTVASLATISTSRPDTRPMPVTMPGARRLVVVQVPRRQGESSRNGDPGSSSWSMRSRTGSFPCSRWRCRYFSPPPWRAAARAFAQLGDQRGHPLVVGSELRARGIDGGRKAFHSRLSRMQSNANAERQAQSFASALHSASWFTTRSSRSCTRTRDIARPRASGTCLRRTGRRASSRRSRRKSGLRADWGGVRGRRDRAWPGL